MRIKRALRESIYSISVAAALGLYATGCADNTKTVVSAAQDPVAQQMRASDDGKNVTFSALNGTDLETYLHDDNGTRNISNNPESDDEPQGFLDDPSRGRLVVLQSTDRSTGDSDLDVVDVNGSRVFSSNTPSEIERILCTYGVNKALVQIDVPVEGRSWTNTDHVAVYDAETNTLTDLIPGRKSFVPWNNFGFTRRHVLIQAYDKQGTELHVLDRETGIVKQILSGSDYYYVHGTNSTGDVAAVYTGGSIKLVNLLTNEVVDVPRVDGASLRFQAMSPDNIRTVYELQDWNTGLTSLVLFDNRTSRLQEIAPGSKNAYDSVVGFAGNDGILVHRSDSANDIESLLQYSIPSGSWQGIVEGDYLAATLLADGTGIVNYEDDDSNRQITAALNPVTGTLTDLAPNAHYSYFSSNGFNGQLPNSVLVMSSTDSGNQLALYSPASGLQTIATSENEWMSGRISPGGKYAVIETEDYRTGTQRLQLYNTATKETVEVDSMQSGMNRGGRLMLRDFSADESVLLYERRNSNESKEVHRFDITTGRSTFVSH